MDQQAEGTPPAPPRRRFNPDQTRQDILDAARHEFSEHGLSGARVEAIAARTNTVKRMIYYYFGSKERLYLTVLEKAYAAIREVEQGLNLRNLPPAEAIRALAAFTFDYQEANPEFIRLVCIENIHHGRHIAQSTIIQSINSAIIEMITDILDRGKAEGIFRADADPIDVHMMISAFCFFRVSNRSTFGVLFKRDLTDPAFHTAHKSLITEAVLRSLEMRLGQG